MVRVTMLKLNAESFVMTINIRYNIHLWIFMATIFHSLGVPNSDEQISKTRVVQSNVSLSPFCNSVKVSFEVYSHNFKVHRAPSLQL